MMRPLLIFPTAVVLLAFLSFFLGATCAAWQWWLGAAAAVAACFWRRPPREAARCALVFLAWMAAAWVGCAVAVAPNWFDESVYHLPAVRMLADGWNPVFDCTPESALRAGGLEPGDCRIFHMVFMPKLVWVFSAVASRFTGDLFNPMVPVLWFLFPAAVLRVWRSMDGAGPAWKALAVPLLYCLLPNSAYVVDAVVTLSAIGLLLAFEEVLAGRRADVLSLVAFSFWMMGSKTPGLVHGGLFWAVFLLFLLRRREAWRTAAAAVAAVAVMLAVACATPYLTSTVRYGHPFYPKYTFDGSRFPAIDLTEDFLTEQNDDARQMGYCGRFVNSFISPSLARAWYRWRLGRRDFMPWSANYMHYPCDGDGASPTRFGMRLAFWLSVVALLAVGRRSFRPLAIMVLVGMCAAPACMLGYVRYVPWWLSPVLFLYVDSAARREARRQILAGLVLLGALSVRPYNLPKRIGYAAKLVEERRCLTEMLRSGEMPLQVRPYWAESVAQIKLMRRHVRALENVELLPFDEHYSWKMRRKGLELPGKLFVFDDRRQMRRWAHVVPEGGMDGLIYVLRTGFVTLPEAVARRVASLFSASDAGCPRNAELKGAGDEVDTGRGGT